MDWNVDMLAVFACGACVLSCVGLLILTDRLSRDTIRKIDDWEGRADD